MKIVRAKTAGFCFGVKRAVETVYKELQGEAGSGPRIYTYGPIIHNDEVVKDMEKRGVKVLRTCLLYTSYGHHEDGGAGGGEPG